MHPIIKQIRNELKKNADPKTKASGERFFREKVTLYGVKTAIVGHIARTYWQEIKTFPKKEIFALCEDLYTSGMMEESFVVSAWAVRLTKQFEEKDFTVFKQWVEKYITNWASCDGFCNHTIGNFIDKYPKYIKELKHWTKSKNRWMRRAASVSLIIPARRGRYLEDIFDIANALLTDSDDMVQKGYGWMLKEASRLHQKEVLDYVMKHKAVMPRTALRYAIELMPQHLRALAMKRE